jgi:hypothetical protein
VKQHTFEFDVENAKVLHDLFALVDEDDKTEPERDISKILNNLSKKNKDYKITITVEEV